MKYILILVIMMSSCLAMDKDEPPIKKVDLDIREFSSSKFIPNGFKISPFDAYKIVVKSRKLSLKHKWVFYFDNRYYYIADTYGRTLTHKNVAKYAVRVDGITGKLIPRKSKNK